MTAQNEYSEKRPVLRDIWLWGLGSCAGTGFSAYLVALFPESAGIGWGTILSGAALTGLGIAGWYYLDDLLKGVDSCQ